MIKAVTCYQLICDHCGEPDLYANCTIQGRWTVIGEAPHLSVSPSLNAGDWHGWIKDGVMTP